MALSSALCASLATILIQRGLQGATFWAGAWINVVVGAIAAWSAALLLVPFEEYSWQAVPYFARAAGSSASSPSRRSARPRRPRSTT
jgi:hypothetical protein